MTSYIKNPSANPGLFWRIELTKCCLSVEKSSCLIYNALITACYFTVQAGTLAKINFKLKLLYFNRKD